MSALSSSPFSFPQFQEFIDEGRLTLRWFPNKNQLSNLADTIRGLDTTDYELFVKIDDDDFYGRDYLLTINEFHSKSPSTIVVTSMTGTGFITSTARIPSLQKDFTTFSSIHGTHPFRDGTPHGL